MNTQSGRELWLLFGVLYFLPVGEERVKEAIWEGVVMVHEYAREHVVGCLMPALFLARAVGTVVGRGEMMRWMGSEAPRGLAYGVGATVGGTLAVCSCTVLGLFAGIWRMGAGLGPAIAFLYSVPAIRVMAVVLTMRV